MPEIEVPANKRSRRTRAALLGATRSILEESGFDVLTMAAVAERAGVTRGAVYMHFDSVADLIGGLFDHVAEVEGLDESLALIWEAPDSVAGLEAWVNHLASYHPKVMAVDLALQRVEATDPAAAAHRARVSAAQLSNCTRVAEWLEEEGRLASGWDSVAAADLLYGLIATELFSRLLGDRGWSQPELVERLTRVLGSALVSS